MIFNEKHFSMLFGDSKPVLIAGPCSAESREQVLCCAQELKEALEGRRFVLRAGIWKPRTMPGGFEGVGAEGLEWLREVKEQFGIPVTTEVANAAHVKAVCEAGINILWVGGRTTTNTFAVQEVAEAVGRHYSLRGAGLQKQISGVTVLVKNPVVPDVALWSGAVERFRAVGVENIILVHRGFGELEKGIYRNSPMWNIPIEMRRRHPDLMMLCDPSHIGGKRELIAPLAQQAMDLDFAGLMVEAHPNPDVALSDAAQQITPAQLGSIVKGLKVRVSATEAENIQLETLRKQLDEIDSKLVALLADRMEISSQIGVYKREHNLPVLQSKRYERLIASGAELAREQGLSDEFVKDIFERIHKESVQQQMKEKM